MLTSRDKVALATGFDSIAFKSLSSSFLSSRHRLAFGDGEQSVMHGLFYKGTMSGIMVDRREARYRHVDLISFGE